MTMVLCNEMFCSVEMSRRGNGLIKPDFVANSSYLV